MGRNARQDAFNQQQANQQQVFGKLSGIANSIPGDLSADQKSGVTQAALGGIDTQFGNTKEEALRRASATGSSAGLPEMLLESGREAAQAKGQAGSQLQEYFAELPVQRALAKAGVFLPMYGTSSQTMGSLAPQQQPSVLNSLIGAAGAAGGGLLAGICWVADELYGPLSGQSIVLRYWMVFCDKPWHWDKFEALYVRYGQWLARNAQNHFLLRRILKFIFDTALSRARRDLGIVRPWRVKCR